MMKKLMLLIIVFAVAGCTVGVDVQSGPVKKSEYLKAQNVKEYIIESPHFMNAYARYFEINGNKFFTLDGCHVIQIIDAQH